MRLRLSKCTAVSPKKSDSGKESTHAHASEGCRRVVRADLADIPVPEASGRHLPVAHHVLADTVVATAEDLGLPLRSESWGMSEDGMRLYGALGFDQ